MMINGLKASESRWARLGPYYAMFPLDFAFDVIEHYSNKGDFVIDPFAGRGSSVYAGAVMGRNSFGIEINPVGWLYGKVKLKPASKKEVLNRLSEIYSQRNNYKSSLRSMPKFFRMCYCDEVLKFLLAARSRLNWKNNNVDATLMSFLLVFLHAKLGEGLSNQMRMTKAMGTNYSIEWWKKNKLAKPPEINPFELITKKIDWRYEKGKPNLKNGKFLLGDSTIKLNNLLRRSKNQNFKFKLLFTSPPYYSVTDYYADQWLRLWLLGGSTEPKRMDDKHKNRFISKSDYFDLLDKVFGDCSKLMDKKSIIYVRTDRRKFTFDTTLMILKKHFPNHNVQITDKPFTKKTQTEIHGNKSAESGEIDIVLTS